MLIKTEKTNKRFGFKEVVIGIGAFAGGYLLATIIYVVVKM